LKKNALFEKAQCQQKIYKSNLKLSFKEASVQLTLKIWLFRTTNFIDESVHSDSQFKAHAKIFALN